MFDKLKACWIKLVDRVFPKYGNVDDDEDEYDEFDFPYEDHKAFLKIHKTLPMLRNELRHITNELDDLEVDIDRAEMANDTLEISQLIRRYTVVTMELINTKEAIGRLESKEY